ncbi:hypothetical protein NP233_g11223 [Leucocoprinus birnbaumii]|uniref:Uncharacterized protein n=1 Tax=Leucocoprinus birnbaumii TaxID=56174 RepID=A0AAD5VGU4_9AGAR|nr:hypothetical protein NP233_g11223 [Leucocoprinus birnbaumii]
MANSSASTLSCSQTVPVDVRRAESECSSAEPDACWDLIIDQTTLDVGFDFECLDGLDDMLLLSPVDAFEAVCWDTAIQLPPQPRSRPLPKPLAKPLQKPRPRPLPNLPEASSTVQKSSIPFPRRRPAPLILTPGTSSEEDEESGYESDSDELRTLKDEGTPLQSPLPSPLPSPAFPSPLPSPLPSPYNTGFHLNHQPTVEPITLIKYSCLPYEFDASFISFEPQHTINYYCEDAIGLSPFNAEQRKVTTVNRIAAFCANLPTRLLRV